jgi:predicted transcriptional regulator
VAAPSITRLSRREREIIHTVFALGNRATASEIRARLSDPPTDASVRVMLRRLEAKGHLRHDQDGVRYVYFATASPTTEKRKALRHYLDTFFGGSLRRMLTTLVREGSFEEGDLDALRQEIDKARKGKKL